MPDFIKSKARREIFTLKPYIPGKPIEEVKRELGLTDVIKLASNENPLGSSPKAMAAVKASISDLHLYPDANCHDLKKKLASVYGMPEKSILIGNGSDELFRLLAETFLESRDQVIFAQPTFSEYEFVSRIMGAECIQIPLKDYTHDLSAIINAISIKTKIIFICNPNNPTGTIVNSRQINEFMEQVPDDILVVFDEAYQEYVESPQYASGLQFVREGRNVLVSRTFSKIYGLAALRIGYALTTPAIAQAVERVAEPFNVNMLAQVAALAALDDTEFIDKSLQNNRLGKEYLYKELTRLEIEYIPTETNFIFLDTGHNCQGVFKNLLQQGIIVRAGDSFGCPNYIRVTIGIPEQNRRFIRSLQKVLGL
ncbi:Pyridoxal phosphate-dependent transferase [Syntrophomonas zehnderi OL-4]|uniref:Histidinol-phosphate aminotransferase n=1 Tax=Syntrophomonas zehnderi OL-4 TaxID=690567 RepID=A0A0E3W3B5_9FIRM|nr:histidinol-phosphate transaminase [Syntrophomonas zehnderi]CFX69669.1 Pyridoxal phosphate-dependent transferase [Syntrophomonas zehnderi OL-4]